MTATRRYESWGRLPGAQHRGSRDPSWRTDAELAGYRGSSLLPFGRGRSYGDSCLNDGNELLDTRWLDHFIAFDRATGRLRCEAGVTLRELVRICLPHGWFPAVVPGTADITLGGAVANDVHGKNQHRQGSFGCHLTAFELARSDGSFLQCSPESNMGMFSATIGGLGLTGLMTWIEIQLRRVPGTVLETEHVACTDLTECLELLDASEDSHEYRVAVVDPFERGRALGSGVVLRANHATGEARKVGGKLGRAVAWPRLGVPRFFLTRPAARVWHAVLQRKLRVARRRLTTYDRFLFPLDGVGNWNRAYGTPGFVQHQSVIPNDRVPGAAKELLRLTQQSRVPCTLATLKRFGPVPSRGVLSFVRPGVCLALDFPMGGDTPSLLERLDAVVVACGGAVNPSKDAHMSPMCFRAGFPTWEKLGAFIDPGFSSSFSRRVSLTPARFE